MSEFSTVRYERTLQMRTDVNYDADGNLVDADGNVVDDPTYWEKLKFTEYWKGEGLDVVHHREGNQPAFIIDIVDDETEALIQTIAHRFIVDGKEYRTNGPTDVQGSDPLDAEYNYGEFGQDVALQMNLEQGLITQEQFDEAIAKYNALPKQAPRDEYDPDAGLFTVNDNLPFADDVAFIVGLLDGAQP